MNKMGFYDFMRAGHVSRWHIVNTTRHQTLAEHLYLVTVIALELSIQPEIKHAVDSELALVMGALFHDVAEIRQGDTPTPAKEFIMSVAGADIFERMEESLLPEIPYHGGKLHQDLWNVITMADRIEAAHWIYENKAGIHADMVAKGCWKKMVQCAVDFGWVEPVNRALLSLGMPYIYKDAMEFAP